jgi:hypothetical protein
LSLTDAVAEGCRNLCCKRLHCTSGSGFFPMETS